MAEEEQVPEMEVMPPPPTAPIIILCPLCEQQLQIDAYMTTQIIGFEGAEIIVSGSLHGTTRHACTRINAS